MFHVSWVSLRMVGPSCRIGKDWLKSITSSFWMTSWNWDCFFLVYVLCHDAPRCDVWTSRSKRCWYFEESKSRLVPWLHASQLKIWTALGRTWYHDVQRDWDKNKRYCMPCVPYALQDALLILILRLIGTNPHVMTESVYDHTLMMTSTTGNTFIMELTPCWCVWDTFLCWLMSNYSALVQRSGTNFCHCALWFCEVSECRVLSSTW